LDNLVEMYNIAHMELETLHEKINRLVRDKIITITDIANKLGITRHTVYIRLRKENWKKSEFEILKKM
jgi:DNA invertase Pin-like site-specific DNA recombinase